MLWPQQPIRIWLTEAGSGALVPRVVSRPEFEALLTEEDHNGFWVELYDVEHRVEGMPGRPVRLIPRNFVASMELPSTED